ncbi:unannotated protein [freshwater metagenome]|uniref:Unannotated protein n=1 Tax=freshwater metagenome TaxID=449393 RepID=A0A6J6S9C3_9ZZZZ
MSSASASAKRHERLPNVGATDSTAYLVRFALIRASCHSSSGPSTRSALMADSRACQAWSMIGGKTSTQGASARSLEVGEAAAATRSSSSHSCRSLRRAPSAPDRAEARRCLSRWSMTALARAPSAGPSRSAWRSRRSRSTSVSRMAPSSRATQASSPARPLAHSSSSSGAKFFRAHRRRRAATRIWCTESGSPRRTATSDSMK